jgi:predicted CoA-binding protein
MKEDSPESKNWENPPPEEIKRILDNSGTVAVVGLSSKPDRASNEVARYLQEQGFEIIPVNPREAEVLGVKAFPDIASIGKGVDIVDVFRRAEDTPPIVREAVENGARCIWLQKGIISQESYDVAREAGIPIIMNACMLVEHKRSRE